MNRSVALVAVASLGLAFTSAMAQTKPGPAAAAPAASAATSADGAIRSAVLKAVPGSVIDSIKPSVIPGYKEVAIGGHIVYVSVDGKYLMQGSLIELGSRNNLTEVSEAVLRRAVLDAVPRDRRIIFSPAKPKYRITVFTDIDCGYCRKLHSQIADYMKAGISVEYLFFPRAGLASESYTKAVNVWCAPDRRKALTDAKADRPVAKRTCANPITMDFALGRRLGIDGTPAIYAADGTQLGGYLSPADMIARLDRQAAKVAVENPPAKTVAAQ
jgi:thiol:disulfide interchange protein DsbC